MKTLLRFNILSSFQGQKILKISAALMVVFGLLVMCNKNLDTTGSTKSCACGTLINVNFGPEVPGDNKLVTGQVQADCFAWAEFVALNWPADPKAGFGTPGDMGSVQWETYMTREVLLPEDGTPPPPWGGWQSPKASALFAKHLVGQPAGTKLLFHQSKFTGGDLGVVLDETGEAFPNDGRPNWLGAQNNTNIWYEVLVNKDEYDYIVKNGFYNADSQYAYVATKGDTISLPKGDDKHTGALELKASWMEVKEPADARWKRYKMSNAILVDQTGKAKKAVVALIGLHILHKTASQPTWFWATFEHIDNVPDGSPNPFGYNLFNTDCKEQQVNVPGGCLPNQNKQDSTYTIGCKPNQIPTYHLCSGAGPVAIQVVREIPIDAEAKMANQQMQAAISKNFPGSVWANYQLVNMIWSTTPQTVQSNRTPQGLKSMQPVIPVANTAAETYIQTLSCFGCHQFAPIAPTAKSHNSEYSADFSFVLKFAGYEGKGKK